MATAEKKQKIWPWFVLLLPAIAAPVIISRIRANEELEENIRGMQSALTIVASVLFAWLWALIMLARGWTARILVFLAPAVLLGIFLSLFRNAGAAGNGIPNWTWRWEPQPDELLEQLTAVEATAEIKAPEGAADFLRFLGSKGENRVDGVVLARDWKAQPPKELWRQTVGAGWTGFVVAGGLAITQEQRGPEEWVVAYKLADGSRVWSHARSVRFSEGQGGDGPRATPTVVGDRVYAMGATGWLMCLELKSGKALWETSVLSGLAAKNLMWGKSCSPLVSADKVVVTGGENPSPSVVAYDVANGKELWRSGLPNDGASYASVVAAKLAGREVLLSVNALSLTIHDPAGGKILASHPWEGNWPKCSDPIVLPDDKILLTAGYQMGDYLLQVKPNGEKLALEVVWNTKGMKTTFNNCTVRDNAVYGIDDGILACMDLKDGKRLWKSERVGQGQILAVGDLLLVQTESGPVLLVEASPAGSKVLGKLKALEGKTWNNLCLAGKYLLARNDKEAVCYELPVVQMGEKK